MRHLNTGIKITENYREVVNYFKNLELNNPQNLNGNNTGLAGYYSDGVNLKCSLSEINVKWFNSIEEHKAYMNQTKIIQIW